MGRLKMTKALQELSLTQSKWTKKNSVLAIPKYFSVQVNWVSWKRSVKTKLEVYLHFYKPKLEVRHHALRSRKCKIRNWPCTACNVPFVTSVLVKLGFGGSFGWLSSLTLNVQSLPSTKQNMKKRLPLQKHILDRLWLIDKR